MHTSTSLRWQAFALLAALVLLSPDPSRASTAWFQGDKSRPEVFVFGDSLSDPRKFLRLHRHGVGRAVRRDPECAV